jgi:hypothetical protein
VRSVRISLRDSHEGEDPNDNGRATRRTVGISGLSLASLQLVAGSALFLFGLASGLYHWWAGAAGSIGADRHHHDRGEKAEPARRKA